MRLLACWVIALFARRVSVAVSCVRRMMRCRTLISRQGWIGGRCRTVRRGVCVVTFGGSVRGLVAAWNRLVSLFPVVRGTALRRVLR